MFFFFKQKTAYEWRISDWSSDVCSSDLFIAGQQAGGGAVGQRRRVAGGESAAAGGLVEGGLERGQLFDRGIGKQDVVARHAAEAHHQVVEQTTVLGGGELVVRSKRPLALPITRAVPRLLPHLPVVAPAFSGAVL